MIQDDYKYIDLTNFNNNPDGGACIPCKLTAERALEVLQPQELDDYLISVARFAVCSNRIPAYIPRIIGQDEIVRITNELTKAHPGAVFLPTNPFITTDMYVVAYNGPNCKIGFLQWQPEDVSSLYPSNTPDRREVINSPFYHCYSSYHLFKLISNLIGTLTGATCLIVVSDDGTQSLLIDSNEYIELSFSNPLWKVLPLLTVPDTDAPSLGMKQVVIDATTLVNVSIGIPSATYFQLSTRKTPVICPFSKIVVLSEITTAPQITSTNMIKSDELTTNIMTDYSLENIGIPDKMYQRILYEPSSYERWIPLRQSVRGLKDFQFSFVCQTPDNYFYHFSIEPKDYVTMKLVLKRVR